MIERLFLLAIQILIIFNMCFQLAFAFVYFLFNDNAQAVYYN